MLGLAGEDLIRKVLAIADDFDLAIDNRPAELGGRQLGRGRDGDRPQAPGAARERGRHARSRRPPASRSTRASTRRSSTSPAPAGRRARSSRSSAAATSSATGSSGRPSIGRTPSLSSSARKLAVDGDQVLDPTVLAAIGRAVVDREVEVVGDRKHLADQVLAGEPEHLLALLGGPAPKVDELGSLPLEAAR